MASNNMKMQLEIITNLDGMNKSMKAMASGTEAMLKTLTGSLGGMFAGINAELKGVQATTQEVAKMLEALQDKPRLAKTADESLKLYQATKMKGFAAVQGGIEKRAVSSQQIQSGMEGFTAATRTMQDFAAMGSMLGAAIKGAGILRSKDSAAAAMRSLSSVQKAAMVENQGLDARKMLESIGGQGGIQKQMAEEFRQRIMKMRGKGTREFNKLMVTALTGVSDADTSAFKDNMIRIGEKAVASMGNTNMFSPENMQKMEKAQRDAMEVFMSSTSRSMADKMKFLENRGIEVSTKKGEGGELLDVKPIKASLNAYFKKVVENQKKQILRNIGEATVRGQITQQEIINSHEKVEMLPKTGIDRFKDSLKKLFGIPAKAAKYAEDAGRKLTNEQVQAQSGIDSFGYRMITISYMFSKVNMVLDQVITNLQSSAITRIESMAKVQPILMGGTTSTSGEVDKYRKELEGIAATTGRSFESLASAMYDAASAFPKVADKMLILRTTSAMAAVGFGNAERSMEGLIAVAKTYYRDLEKDPVKFEAMIKRLGNLSIEAANVGVLELDELANAMQNMAPTASALGITIEELYASLAATAGVIGNTGEASTRLQQMYTSFLSPTTQGMRDLYSTEQVGGGRDFIAKMGGLQQAIERVAKFAEERGQPGDYKSISGRAQGAMAMMGLEGGSAEFLEFLGKASTSFTSLADAQWKATHGVGEMAVKMKAASQEFETIKTTFGEAMLPMQVSIQKAINGVLGILGKGGVVTESVANFGVLVSKVAVVLGGAMAFAGGLALATRAVEKFSIEVASAGALQKYRKAGGIGDPAISWVQSKLGLRGVVAGTNGQGVAAVGAANAFSAGGALKLITTVGAIGVAIAGITSVAIAIRNNQVKKLKETATVSFDQVAARQLGSWGNRVADAMTKYEKSTSLEESTEAVQALGNVLDKLRLEPLQAARVAAAAFDSGVSPVKPITMEAYRKQIADAYYGRPLTQIEVASHTAKQVAWQSNWGWMDTTKDEYLQRAAKDIRASGEDKAAVKAAEELIDRYLEGLMSMISSASSVKPTGVSAAEERKQAAADAATDFKNSLQVLLAKFQDAIANQTFDEFNFNEQLNELMRGYVESRGAATAGGAATKLDAMNAAQREAEAILAGVKSWAATDERFAEVLPMIADGVSVVGEVEMAIDLAMRDFSRSAEIMAHAGTTFVEGVDAQAALAQAEAGAQKAFREVLAKEIKNSGELDYSQLEKLTKALEPLRQAAWTEGVWNKSLSTQAKIQGIAMPDGPQGTALGWVAAAARRDLAALAGEAFNPSSMSSIIEKMLAYSGYKSQQLLSEGSAGNMRLLATKDSTQFVAAVQGIKSFADILKLSGDERASFMGSTYSAMGLAVASSEVKPESFNEYMAALSKLDMSLSGDRAAAEELKASFDVFGETLKEMNSAFREDLRTFQNAGVKQREEAYERIAQLRDDLAELPALGSDVKGSDETRALLTEAIVQAQNQVSASRLAALTDDSAISRLVASGVISGGADRAAEGMGGGFLGKLFGGALSGLATFTEGLLSVIGPLNSVMLIMSPFKTILKVMVDTLAPTIDSVLAPLVGVFAIIGQLLAAIVLPVIQILGPLLMAFASIFVTVYNLLLPVFEAIHDIFAMIGIALENFFTVVMQAVSWLTFWTAADDKYWNDRAKAMKNPLSVFGETTLTAITLDQTVGAGAELIGGDSGSSGSTGGAEATRLPDQNFYFYIGADMITDVDGGKVVSVDYLWELFLNRLSMAQSVQA